MAPITTDAVVLHTFPYGETSRIARLLTLEHGVQSVVAKGAMRPKSRMGSVLQVFNEGALRFYFKRQRDLHTLAGFDVHRQRSELASHMRRFTAASAMAELVIRFAPTEPHPEIYAAVTASLDSLGACREPDVEWHALAALWGVVAALGFAPSLDVCARDGAVLPPDGAVFSVSDGGLLCSSCARGAHRRAMPRQDRLTLAGFVNGSPSEAAIGGKRLAAHRRLLEQFVERHVAEGRDLQALRLWSASA